MTLEQLKEILRAAAELTQQSEFYVIGSSAILSVFHSPTQHYLSRSNEADLIAISGEPDIADRISTMIGELSPFHDMHDVYAEGVTFETPAFAPDGWRERSISARYDDIGVTAHFMELHDLALSKIGAGRPKDTEFCSELAATGYLDRAILLDRLSAIQCSDTERSRIRAQAEQIFRR